ncbi:MAG: 4-hydroxy-tetrahydrodipicolinate synthase [Maribacter sp.]|jgi:4-hydroxy-tetrahydrodipicolinate synthase
MNHNRFRGTGVALVTPFRNGEIDFPALEKVINHCINGGVDFLVSLGTTGESATLSKKEHTAILDFTIQVNKGRLPIVAGFSGNNTKALIQSMNDYHFNGIDAILTSSPAYNKPSQGGLYQHYMELAKYAPKPIIIYNVPSRTGSNISADTTLRLAHASKKFIGIKEAAYDLGQVAQIIKNKPKGFLVLSGDDTIALPSLSIGGDGVISVIANALPEHFSRLIRLGLGGDFKKASKIHLRIFDLHEWLYKDGNPAGIKAAMEMMNICGQETRLPLVPASEEVYEAIRQELMNINVIVPDAIA